jgi:hypothetical protein
VKSEEVCCICGFDIGNAEHKGRQWGGSWNVYEGKWICGSCGGIIRDFYIEQHRG